HPQHPGGRILPAQLVPDLLPGALPGPGGRRAGLAAGGPAGMAAPPAGTDPDRRPLNGRPPDRRRDLHTTHTKTNRPSKEAEPAFFDGRFFVWGARGLSPGLFPPFLVQGCNIRPVPATYRQTAGR